MKKEDIDFEVKNVYMWLHPERPPAVLLITPSFQIVYHEIKEGAKDSKDRPKPYCRN